MKPHRSPKQQGEWAEVCFLLRALTLGLRVSQPYGDDCPYDFILDDRRRLLRIQVKSVLIPQQGFYQLKTAGGNRSKRRYTAREVDFICALVIPERAWYIIPLRALRGRKTIRVCPHRPSRRPFERFRNAWHLLMGRKRVEQAFRPASTDKISCHPERGRGKPIRVRVEGSAFGS